MKSRLSVLLLLFIIPLWAANTGDKIDYLDLAMHMAETVERTAWHQPTGLYASLVDTESGAPYPKVDVHHAGWYLPGLWMLYYRTGDPRVLSWIDRHSAAFWEKSIDPATGLPWLKYDLEKQGPRGKTASHRIQYQSAARGHWEAYQKSLRSAWKYQVVTDSAGNVTLLNNIDARRPGNPAGMISPDYFGCLDLRIPYAMGVLEGDSRYFDAAINDFITHAATPLPNTTGLWSGGTRVTLFRKRIVPNYIWTGTIADDTYTGLILRDLIGNEEFLDIVTRQTRLALQYCYNDREHYFLEAVNTVTGSAIDPSPRWHTNWEWALTLFILHEATGDESWLEAGLENYRFLMDNLGHPGHYSSGEGDDWNVMQIPLLSIFRYHQTGDERYLVDAFNAADHLIENRLRFEGDNVYIGLDRLMDLREAGDFISMLVCLSDPSLPVVSTRYFLFPVGIRSPSFPVLGSAWAERFFTRDDGVLEARVKGGSGVEDIHVMDLSGEVQWVKLNGRKTDWREKKVAGHRYIVVPGVELGEVEIEIYSP